MQSTAGAAGTLTARGTSQHAFSWLAKGFDLLKAHANNPPHGDS